MSKSSSIIARQYFRDIILRQYSKKKVYCFEKGSLIVSWDDSTILPVFALLRPQGFTVRIESRFDLERWNSLLVHLSGLGN